MVPPRLPLEYDENAAVLLMPRSHILMHKLVQLAVSDAVTHQRMFIAREA